MKLGLNILGFLLALVGLVWLLQGIGILQGSIMSDQSQWAIIGVVVVVIGAGLLVYNNRRQAQS
jgi:hypothetical protein